MKNSPIRAVFHFIAVRDLRYESTKSDGGMENLMGNRRSHGKNRRNLIWKWMLVIVILALLVTGIVCAIKSRFVREPEGVYINREDAYLLYTYLYGDLNGIAAGEMDRELVWSISQNSIPKESEEENNCLTLKEAQIMFSLLKERYPVYEGEIQKISEGAFPDNKKESSFVLAEEFFSCYKELWQAVHGEYALYEETGIVLGDGERLKNLDDTPVSSNSILLGIKGDKGKIAQTKLCQGTNRFLHYQKPAEEDFYKEHIYLGTEGYLLFDLSDYRPVDEKTEFFLQTCWISSNQAENLWITMDDFQLSLYRNAEGVRLEDGSVYDSFEDIADIYFAEGKLSYIATYDDRVSGKLLSVSDDRIELEGMGFYPYRDNLAVYKLYGQKEYYTKGDLKIGYDFTDFVLDKEGTIVAGLVTREEKMDSIRVVIKTTGFASAYHESVTFTCDSDFLVNEEHHLAGEEITVNVDDERLAEGRIYIRPETNLARTSITSIERDQGVPSYRGNFEIAKASEGLLLINELLLEEYLYSVVPSEMPASYPIEALKAQAVSARTYAYQRMVHSGLKEYGAHVDDSAAFQVYNNIKENENTTIAIRQTQGQIAMIGESLAETYYYSTSCGFGTDIGAWHGSSEADYSYLVSRHIAKGETDTGNITDEEVFRNYIMNTDANDFEAEEGWYRWRYETNLNIDRLNENLVKRYEASAKSILVPDESGNFISGKPPVFTKIVRIAVVKRGNGGVMDELLIEGAEGYVKVVGEHAIRSVLANEKTTLTRQNGSESAVSTMLPSAFGVIDVQVDGETNAVTAYTVTGGGYGHGIGMSQNGAKYMALEGMTCGDILQFFYQGITLQNIGGADM